MHAVAYLGSSSGRGGLLHGASCRGGTQRSELWHAARHAQPKYGYLAAWSGEDVGYFRRMPFSLAIPSHGVLVVHAGVVPGRPLRQQRLTDLINVSCFPVLSDNLPSASCAFLAPLSSSAVPCA